MFNVTEKEEFKRIISKYVEEGRCTRPIHPDEVIQEVKRFNRLEGLVEEVVSTELVSNLPSASVADGWGVAVVNPAGAARSAKSTN